MFVDASYLRNLAQQCVALARQCPHLPTSQALEALSVELMARASEVKEELLMKSAGNDDVSK
jgi:hypothetical protein